jgi:hypothetical protein
VDELFGVRMDTCKCKLFPDEEFSLLGQGMATLVEHCLILSPFSRKEEFDEMARTFEEKKGEPVIPIATFYRPMADHFTADAREKWKAGWKRFVRTHRTFQVTVFVLYFHCILMVFCFPGRFAVKPTFARPGVQGYHRHHSRQLSEGAAELLKEKEDDLFNVSCLAYAFFVE